MTTRILMIASALVMAAIGLLLSFAPDEVFAALGGEAAGPWTTILQVCGALYFGFAMMNWMAKGAVLGGIYGRPIVIGNLVHSTVGGLALLKCISQTTSPLLIGLAVAYAVFACLFGWVMFTHPAKSDPRA